MTDETGRNSPEPPERRPVLVARDNDSLLRTIILVDGDVNNPETLQVYTVEDNEPGIQLEMVEQTHTADPRRDDGAIIIQAHWILLRLPVDATGRITKGSTVHHTGDPKPLALIPLHPSEFDIDTEDDGTVVIILK